MYFPYLRGRQFELIALRELIQKKLITSKIIPIIEPVKLTSTLCSCISVYIKQERDILVVQNSKKGSFNINKSPQKKDFQSLISSSNFIITHILNKNSESDYRNSMANKKTESEIASITLERDFIDKYHVIFGNKVLKYNIVVDDRTIRRKLNKNLVILDDKFKKKDKNSLYKEIDEFFSDEHLYFEDDFIGFSDYSIIGDHYFDSGFAPYAVSIHIVYFDDKNELRIKHFTSDSNDDIQDPAGKFYEALSKLHEWNKKMKLNTYAIQEFEKYYDNKNYPGLGTIKKLSIMHHLELMSTFLESRK